MGEILHHLEAMGNHCLLVGIHKKIIIPSFLKWCRISSIHSMTKPTKAMFDNSRIGSTWLWVEAFFLRFHLVCPQRGWDLWDLSRVCLFQVTPKNDSFPFGCPQRVQVRGWLLGAKTGSFSTSLEGTQGPSGPQRPKNKDPNTNSADASDPEAPGFGFQWKTRPLH